MSDSSGNRSAPNVVKNVGVAGLLAATAGFFSNQYSIEGDLRELLNVLIPPICVVAANFFVWIFGILNMGTAEEINAKRKINKSIKQCIKELKNEDISDSTKAEIQKRIDNLTIRRLDMGLPTSSKGSLS